LKFLNLLTSERIPLLSRGYVSKKMKLEALENWHPLLWEFLKFVRPYTPPPLSQISGPNLPSAYFAPLSVFYGTAKPCRLDNNNKKLPLDPYMCGSSSTSLWENLW